MGTPSENPRLHSLSLPPRAGTMPRVGLWLRGVLFQGITRGGHRTHREEPVCGAEMKGMLTFEFWDGYDCTGSVTVPAPRHWYHRWPLRLAAFIWRVVAAAEARPDRVRLR